MGLWLCKKAAALLALLVCLAGCTGHRPSDDARLLKEAKSTDAAGTVTRRIYPYSLIPGGVQSAAELQTYAAVDHALAEHYAEIGSGLDLTKTTQDQRLYASYRISDAIYWTKKPLLVHAGEAVLSNGKDMVRARCGNRLSVTPRTPVRQFEPPPIYTDTFIPQVVLLQPPSMTEPFGPPALPDFPPVAPPERSSVPPAIETGGRTSVPPAVLTSGANKVPTAVNTPEPETWLLMLAGLSGIGAAGTWRARRNASIRRSTVTFVDER